MKNFLKSYWKTLLFFTLAGIVGGFCCGLYLLDSYPPEIVQEITDQGLTPFLAGVVSAYQAAGYGLVLGALGILLARKIGLWKNETKFENKPLLAAVIIAIIGGVGIILPDLLYFGNHIPAVQESYLAKLPCVHPDMIYTLTDRRNGATKTLTSEELAVGMEIRLPKRSAVIWFYEYATKL